MRGIKLVVGTACGLAALLALGGLGNRLVAPAGRAGPPALSPALVLGTRNGPAEEQACGVAIAPDGRHFAVAARGGGVTVRTLDGETVVAWQAHDEPVYAICFLADSQTVLTVGRSGGLRVWDLSTATPSLRTEGQDATPALSAAASPDGATVAVGSSGRVGVWRVEGSRLTRTADLVAPPFPIHSLAVAADGRAVAAGNGGDGRVRVWRLENQSAVEEYDASADCQLRGVGFAPDGRTLLTADTEGAVVAAGAGGPVPLGWLPGPVVRQAVFSPDGRLVLAACLDGTARLTRYNTDP